MTTSYTRVERRSDVLIEGWPTLASFTVIAWTPNVNYLSIIGVKDCIDTIATVIQRCGRLRNAKRGIINYRGLKSHT